MIDHNGYVVIDEVTFYKMVDFLRTAREMASHSYDHLTEGYDILLRQVRERAEIFRGTNNKPITNKLFEL